jgi:hypothetical protein
MKRSSTLQIFETDGNRYADLRMAQAAALGDVAQAVVNVVRVGLAQEKLTVVDGKVVFIDDHKDKQA